VFLLGFTFTKSYYFFRATGDRVHKVFLMVIGLLLRLLLVQVVERFGVVVFLLGNKNCRKYLFFGLKVVPKCLDCLHLLDDIFLMIDNFLQFLNFSLKFCNVIIFKVIVKMFVSLSLRVISFLYRSLRGLTSCT
jgi:hypothetical protein